LSVARIRVGLWLQTQSWQWFSKLQPPVPVQVYASHNEVREREKTDGNHHHKQERDHGLGGPQQGCERSQRSH